MTDKQFPLVSDDEIMLTEMPHMNLYDELDLISNITGDYTDRNYLEWMPIVDSNRHAYDNDPYGIRTRVTAVKGRCLNHLTNGPY